MGVEDDSALGEEATGVPPTSGHAIRALLSEPRALRVALAVAQMPGGLLDGVAALAGLRPSWVARCIRRFEQAGLVEVTLEGDARVTPTAALHAWLRGDAPTTP